MDAMNAYTMPGTKPILLSKADMPNIFNYLCGYYNEANYKVDSKSRKRELVFIRHLFMYIFSMYGRKISLKTIGKFFRCQYDHTTVIHGRNHIKDLMFSDPDIKLEVEYLKIECGL